MKSRKLTISTRIVHIKEVFNIPSNAALADFAQVTKVTVGNWINKNTMPSSEALTALRKEFGINPDWVRTGEEPMLLPPESPKELQHYIDQNLESLSEEERKIAATDLLRTIAKFL